jgi:oxygen-independent coproporphyrinogen-3 oxidase
MTPMNLIRKYNVPGPRYTSYPTVPHWNATAPTQDEWKKTMLETFTLFNNSEGLSIYVHLPYCESLCTYCGCNTRITVNHKVEIPYIEAVLKEWAMVVDALGDKPNIKEIHLGGGTPTFFSPDNLKFLIDGLLALGNVMETVEFGFEGHPNNTSFEHLKTLYDLGFRRLSLGIQDFDPVVQDVINRIQPVENVERVTLQARELGYTSVNFDLIYGLPMQTMHSIEQTIDHVIGLKPDRIAFYSYAHVPWIKPGQRKFTELDLPDDETKRALYEGGRTMLEKAGYLEVGMDHFALEQDELYQAFKENRLHRNFMGYTTCSTHLLVGLGVSAISDSWLAFSQNEKKVEDYLARINQNELPIFKGHILTDEDLIIRQHILNLMCTFKTIWKDPDYRCEALFEGLGRLDDLIEDELVVLGPDELYVTDKGKPFVRNVCMAFDAKLWRNKSGNQLFSKVI